MDRITEALDGGNLPVAIAFTGKDKDGNPVYGVHAKFYAVSKWSPILAGTSLQRERLIVEIMRHTAEEFAGR